MLLSHFVKKIDYFFLFSLNVESWKHDSSLLHCAIWERFVNEQNLHAVKYKHWYLHIYLEGKRFLNLPRNK